MKLSSKKVLAILVAEFGSLDAAMLSDTTEGICLSCGYIQDGVEPDAECYRCEDCGEYEVCGIEHVILTMI